MKLTQRTFLVLLIAGLAMVAWKGSAQTVDDEIQVARSALKADRLDLALRLQLAAGIPLGPLKAA